MVVYWYILLDNVACRKEPRGLISGRVRRVLSSPHCLDYYSNVVCAGCEPLHAVASVVAATFVFVTPCLHSLLDRLLLLTKPSFLYSFTLRNVAPVSCPGPSIFALTPTACTQPLRTALRHVQSNEFIQAFLVGILGEDRITCIGGKMLGSLCGDLYCFALPLLLFATGVILLIALCVLLLNNEAVQVMAVALFPGTDYRSASVFGLVLCVSVLVAVLAWILTLKQASMRLVEQCLGLGTASLNQ